MGKIKTKIGSGEVSRYDQKNTVFSRASWDPTISMSGEDYIGDNPDTNRPGYSLKDWAFSQASWYVEKQLAKGSRGIGNFGLYRWHVDLNEIAKESEMMPGWKYEISDPVRMSADIKTVAKFLGASLVGICQLDPRWVYTHSFNRLTDEHLPVEIPPEFERVIVLAYEEDYRMIKLSPTALSCATVADCYSKMAFVCGRLAHFIRALGYKAIPCGNDTALSVPLAIDAGLGQLGRNGILITREFGPRVRLSKVFTNMPLVPDKPIDFGVTEFCNSCGLCAENCPAKAISFGEPTFEGPSISNNHGLYKWYINPERCFRFWKQDHGGSKFGRYGQSGCCSNCKMVCSFNKPPGWLHDMARFFVRDVPQLNSLFVLMDKLFGYSKRGKVEEFWKLN